jgi:hypothetical protein
MIMESYYVFLIENGWRIFYPLPFVALVVCVLVTVFTRIHLLWILGTALFGVSLIMFGVQVGNATEKLAPKATIPVEVTDFSGVVTCRATPGLACGSDLLIESPDDGRRITVWLRGPSTIVNGDGVTLSALAMPDKQFSFPAVCRARDCWMVSWTDEATCKLSSADACGRSANENKGSL